MVRIFNWTCSKHIPSDHILSRDVIFSKKKSGEWAHEMLPFLPQAMFLVDDGDEEEVISELAEKLACISDND